MRYTQSQIRELLSISVDAFRTWREAIPALAAHKGHAPSFTPGDVVATAVVAELVRDFGVRVGTFSSRFDQLFCECRGKSWISLEKYVAIFDVNSFDLVDVTVLHSRTAGTSTIHIPCAPIVSHLRSVLTASEAEPVQGYLHFPPAMLDTRIGQRKKSA